jgi:hypothetical protein
MKTSSRFPLFLLLLLPFISLAQSPAFSFTDKKNGLQILYSKEGPKLDSIAAHLLARDIKMVTGNLPPVIADLARAKGNVVVIGNVTSMLVQQFIGNKSLLTDSLKNKWECYGLKVIDNPGNNISKALIIAGSDARGTAFGVFDLSEKMGVSPWYWWADVPVKQQNKLILHLPQTFSTTPGVKYRGIFINDEDWGLQPWAAKTFEPETGDIGSNTYAKVFELLLRLKANLIWPAMHPSTKAFFYYPQNKKVAEDYSIVVGSSHAEPMLRNNVGEWDEKTMGHFNYITNKEKVYQYWESRIKESTAVDAIYTMGMRGVHDSGMEGVKNAKEAVPLLEQIIKEQRDMLAKYKGTAATSIPQAFTAYKEVLEIYDNGLRLPDDITLVWPDDNYGYIQRLNNEEEQARSGGAGVYYHASYWGRPHDYLWLSSTHPGLMREEMVKAFETGADRIWVLNVGDIKPIEYNMHLFLAMAFDAQSYEGGSYVRKHLNKWVGNIFGKEPAAEIESVLWQYYQLAFERRPEFMGWSRTEPTTQTTTTQYNHFFYGDEAQRRIDQYEALERKVRALLPKMEGERAAAFYQLVYYPVMGASWMNKKFLYRDKAIFYAKQNRLSANDYAALSKAVYDSIIKETAYYNNLLAGGKWKNIMSMKPRDLPVYKAPEIPEMLIDGSAGWSIAPEGFVTKDSSLLGTANELKLPAYDNLNQQRYFIDVFLNDKKQVKWNAVPSHSWIRLSKSGGSLEAEWGKNQVRIWVDVDWRKAPETDQLTGDIIFKGGDKQMKVTIQGRRLQKPGGLTDRMCIENNGVVSIHASSWMKISIDGGSHWEPYPELGYTGMVLRAFPRIDIRTQPSDTGVIRKMNSRLDFIFYSFTAAAPKVTVFTLPTQPLNNKFSMRYAVSIDDGPLTIVDFKTVGRSEEWKNNVLRNRAERTIQLPHLKNGLHTLKVYCVDPGVILDEIRIDLGGLKKAYSALPETKMHP